MQIEPSSEWLQAVESELAGAGVAHEERPWHALVKWAAIRGGNDLVPPDEAKRVLGWFGEKIPQARNMIGPLYVGCFFFERRTWPVFVPLIYGQRRVPLFSSLRTM
jgi:hypothetical protein